MADSSAASAPRKEGNAGSGSDFRQLSRRIAAWTTNGLATALVLVLGLAFGRQVLLWWRQPPPQLDAANAAAEIDPLAPQHLAFGGMTTTMQTRGVRGSREEVLAALRAMCRPAADDVAASERPIGPAEEALLAELSGKEPKEASGNWRIDELPQEMPMVVSSRRQLLAEPARILSIGLAFSAEEGEWKAYAFRLDDQASAARAAGASLPLPPESRRVLTLTQPDGSAITSFVGRGEPQEWERHFRLQLPQQGWQMTADGVLTAGRWHAKFQKQTEPHERAEIHFGFDAKGRLHGLAIVAPANAVKEEP